MPVPEVKTGSKRYLPINTGEGREGETGRKYDRAPKSAALKREGMGKNRTKNSSRIGRCRPRRTTG